MRLFALAGALSPPPFERPDPRLEPIVLGLFRFQRRQRPPRSLVPLPIWAPATAVILATMRSLSGGAPPAHSLAEERVTFTCISVALKPQPLPAPAGARRQKPRAIRWEQGLSRLRPPGGFRNLLEGHARQRLGHRRRCSGEPAPLLLGRTDAGLPDPLATVELASIASTASVRARAPGSSSARPASMIFTALRFAGGRPLQVVTSLAELRRSSGSADPRAPGQPA